MTPPPNSMRALGEVARLDELIDRSALAEVCRSMFNLFGLPIRVFSRDGALLADVHTERVVCKYVNSTRGGRAACAATVGAVRSVDPEEKVAEHPCFTGAIYRVVAIEYDGRRLGRFVIGPYLPAETREVPRSLVMVDESIDPASAREALGEMPRVRTETAERIVAHLRGMLDLILFSGHRAHLTSEMHLASVRESYRDLTEKTAKLQAAYDKLKELDKLKSNFLATVSHELRTPLTSVIGYSEMLASGVAGPLNTEQAEFVDTIRVKGDQLLALITSLLDLSKLEQGSLALALEEVDPVALVEDIASTLLPIARKKNVSIRVDAQPDMPKMRADAVRIRQVVSNLADNAMKFTPEGGEIVLGVRLGQRENDAGEESAGAALFALPERVLELSVQDSGMGIPKAEQGKIFDAFYQVDGSTTRQHGGAGLGLSIVKRLVDAHNGTIRIDSEPGKGARFTVSLPESALV